MNVLRKSILIGFTVLGMAAAHAQEAAPAGRHDAGARKEHMQAKMADMFAKRQARLHDQLKLTAQQESAWATYQAAIKPAPMSGTPPDRKAFAKLPAPERMAKMLDFSKQRQVKDGSAPDRADRVLRPAVDRAESHLRRPQLWRRAWRSIAAAGATATAKLVER
jgi:hypothetical protein